MEYRTVVAVTGLPGLYQLVNTKNDGAFVRNLANKTVKFVSARLHQITPLESIEIYTYGDNVRLHEVFEGIKGLDAELTDLMSTKKADKEIRAFFGKVLPEFDQERVYTSDIKKIFKWYEILKNANMLNFDFYYDNNEAVEVSDIVLENKTEENA